MEQAFDDLEHKFKTLDEERPAAKAPAKPETAPEPKD
jgi:hypothetical protein